MSKSSYSIEQKLWAIEQVLVHKHSIYRTAQSLGSSRKTVMDWVDRYQHFGIADFVERRCNHMYPKELKENAVRDYLAGNGSQFAICQKYGIRSRCVLQKWIQLYNDSQELKSTGTGRMIIMKQGRKTTYQERIEIVQYCIEHEMNYNGTAKKYEVSYRQVYGWVRTYKQHGIDGLTDKRGKRKPQEELTELEKLQAQNRLLKAENRKLELEAAFLKKLDEMERGRY